MIEYLKMIRDTETELYSAKKLLDKLYLLYSDLEKPIPPAKPEPLNLKVSFNDMFSNTKSCLAFFGIIFPFGLFLIMFIVPIFTECSIDEFFHSLFPSFLPFLLLFLFIIYICVKYLIKRKREIEQKLINDHNIIDEQYNKNYTKFQLEINEYNKLYNERKQTEINVSNLLKNDISELQNRLSSLYGLNIIYSKYHDWIAVCSFLEYFESGRCDKLDGTTGAYNLYESEKRQNSIIAELSKIGNNLETIKLNQYELYCAMTSANTNIDSVLNDIKNQQALEIFENRLNAQMITVSNYLSKM